MKKLKSISEFKADNGVLATQELSSVFGGKSSCWDEQYSTNHGGQSDTEYTTYSDCNGTVTYSGWIEYANGDIIDY